VSGVVDGHTIQIGNTRMAKRLGWDTGIPLFVMQISRFISVFVLSIEDCCNLYILNSRLRSG
jgi:hypothetical protein